MAGQKGLALFEHFTIPELKKFNRGYTHKHVAHTAFLQLNRQFANSSGIGCIAYLGNKISLIGGQSSSPQWPA